MQITQQRAGASPTNPDVSTHVSLDKAITTMRDRGRDMKSKQKESARGGLAVNVIEC